MTIETVIKRHRDTEPVVFVEVLRTDHKAVIDDIDVTERCALRCPGRAGRELDVDRLIRRQGRGIQRGGVAVAAVDHRVEVQHAGRGIGPGTDHGLEARQLRGGQRPRRAIGQFRGQLLQHAEIVARLEMGRGDEGGAADLVQHVFDFAHTVCRIDRHQDDADPRGGELREQPFVAVRRPNTDPVALSRPSFRKPCASASTSRSSSAVNASCSGKTAASRSATLPAVSFKTSGIVRRHGPGPVEPRHGRRRLAAIDCLRMRARSSVCSYRAKIFESLAGRTRSTNEISVFVRRTSC